MIKLISGVTSIACIMLFLAIVGFTVGVSEGTFPKPSETIQTSVSTSTADKPIEPIKRTYTQTQYTPYIDYVDRAVDIKTEIPEEEITAIARMMYGECNSSWISTTEKAACAWVVCNRVDSGDSYFPDTVIEVVAQKGGFYGYKESHPVTDELYDIALDVLQRWYSEYEGMPYSSGRVLPSNYLFFTGDGYSNVFRDSYRQPYQEWDFSLESPYEN